MKFSTGFLSRVPRTGLLFAGFLLVVPSCDEAPPPAVEEPAEADFEERADELRERIAHHEAGRKRALDEVRSIRKQLREQEASIAALTTEIARKRAEIEKRMTEEPAAPEIEDPPPPDPVAGDDGDGSVLPDELLNQVTPKVVVIEGDKGSGTGFLCSADNGVWVYTAAHVLSKNMRIKVRDNDGTVYREFDYMECAEGVDLVRLKPTDAEFEGLELVQAAEAPEIGDVIVAIGNSLGAGSLSGEPGKVEGIDDDMWEVDAEIIPGNSGGPVLDLETGKVAGIVTHLLIKRGRVEDSLVGEDDTRRFAARLDKEWEWRRMPVSRFVKEWQYIEEMNTETLVAWASIYLMYFDSDLKRHADDDLLRIAKEIAGDNRSHMHVQTMQSWLKRYRSATSLQMKEMLTKRESLVEGMIDEIRIGKNDPAAQHFSWFHRQAYEVQREWRLKLAPED